MSVRAVRVHSLLSIATSMWNASLHRPYLTRIVPKAYLLSLLFIVFIIGGGCNVGVIGSNGGKWLIQGLRRQRFSLTWLSVVLRVILSRIRNDGVIHDVWLVHSYCWSLGGLSTLLLIVRPIVNLLLLVRWQCQRWMIVGWEWWSLGRVERRVSRLIFQI